MVIIRWILYYNFKSVSNRKLIFICKNICVHNFSFCPAIYFINKLNALLLAEVVKLVDALDSKSSILRDVWVRDPPSAQRETPS